MPYYLPWLTDAILLPFYRTCRCPEKKKKTCNETTGTKLGIENKFYLKKTNYILHICRSLGVKNSKDKSETKRMKQANSHPLIQWFTNLCCGHRHLFLSMGGNLTPSSFQEGGSPTPQLIETTACDCGSVVSRKLHWQRVSIMGNIWNSRSRNVNWRIFPYFFYLFTEINKHFACSFMLTTVNWTDNAWRYQSALLFAAIVGMWTIFPVDFFYVPLVLAMLIYKGNNFAVYQPESR